MARSSRSEIAAAVRAVTKPIRKRSLTRAGIPTPTAREVRQRDPNNFRDLSTPIRHLTYHACPFANSSAAWEWNLEQLRQRWHLFNGTKVLGVTYDKDTVSPDHFLMRCDDVGLIWDHVVVLPNSRGLGEVVTWIPSLELLTPDTAGPNEVVFSAHAKGVKYGEVIPPVILDWASVMYSVNLSDWNRVQQSLEWFAATGAFRTRYSRTKSCQYGWYYSGAFFWWRLADIIRGDWRYVGQMYPGREVWIGHQFQRNESDCLFLDNSASPYLPQYWRSKILPKWNKYQAERQT